MLEFQLFRIKVFPSRQRHLFRDDKKPPEILKEVIYSLPSAELRKNIIWYIGNLTEIDNDGLYFRIGRTAKFTFGSYVNGNFVDQEFNVAPYTHVLLDFPLEIVAISKNSKISRKTPGIAKKLIQLLGESDRCLYYGAKFEISEINDPIPFITHIHQSKFISKFWVSFTRPNAWDSGADFWKPMERLLEESGGQKGKTSLEGEELDPDILENLARTAAATGNDAAAWVQMEEDKTRTKKSLKGNPIIIREEDISDINQKASLLVRIRNYYKKIRGEQN